MIKYFKCPRCDGKGKLSCGDKCRACGGKGKLPKI